MAQNLNKNPSMGPSSTPEMALREDARKRIMKRTLIQSHIIAYVVVNLLLYAINMYMSDPTVLWYPWALTGWGIGLAIHLFTYIARNAKLMGYHIFIYAIVNLYLTFIDWYPDRLLNWVLWPVIFWGLGLIGHFIIYLFYRPTKGEDPNKSWLDRKIDAEMKSNIKISSTNGTNSTNISCRKCGHENVKGAQFCSICGEIL